MMEEFLLQLQNEDSPILSKVKTIFELCDEISSYSPHLFDKFLESLLKKYEISIPEKKKISKNSFDIQTAAEVDFIINPSVIKLVPDETSSNVNTTETNISHWNSENIAADVAAVANKTLEDNGFVYDKGTGLYYDHNSQCHYNPELKLYYYHQTEAYYYYDNESQSLKFYCKATSDSTNPSNVTDDDANRLQEAPSVGQINPGSPLNDASNALQELSSNEEPCKRFSSLSSYVSKKAKEDCLEKEEGECSDSEDEIQGSPGSVVIEAGPKSFEPNHSKHIAPCIRVLVKSSLLESLNPGTLFIVTCTGGTLGREGVHDVLIPDQLVSKLHSSFQYVYKNGTYFFELIDMGSKNGTFLNGKRLSETLVKSEPVEITHGSVITVGNTDLLCHIHPKDEVCNDCMAYILDKGKKIDLSSELTLKEKHDYERGVIRKKFGLVNSFVKLPSGYEDRSELRRKTVGSSHPSEKTQTSSADVSIDKQNKGFLLMTKMGWVEGTGIGKNSGIVEPIHMESNEGKTGLGCAESSKTTHLTNKEAKKKSVAKKTLERYNQLQ